jgi:hypothetical protein
MSASRWSSSRARDLRVRCKASAARNRRRVPEARDREIRSADKEKMDMVLTFRFEFVIRQPAGITMLEQWRIFEHYENE